MLNVTHMAALLVRLLPLIHVLSQHHLVLRVSNIARAIKYKPNVQCWEKYPGASWGCCLPEVCFCYKKEMWLGSTHQAVREGCSLGSERKSWVSLEICLILPPPHSSTPLFLSTSSSPLFMFEVTRHKPEMGTGVSEAECVGLCWKWRAVIPAHAFGIWRYTASSAYALCGFQGDDSSRQGSPLLFFFVMPSIYSAKCERQEGRSISSWYLGRIPFSFPLPAPSCIVETETFLWETLHLWHNSMIFNPISSAFFSPSLSSHNSQAVWDYQYN